jgi:hypothetical protein
MFFCTPKPFKLSISVSSVSGHRTGGALAGDCTEVPALWVSSGLGIGTPFWPFSESQEGLAGMAGIGFEFASSPFAEAAAVQGYGSYASGASESCLDV